MDDKDRELFRRMAEAQERIAATLDKQQPGRFSQAVATGAAAATVFGVVNIIDIVAKWIGG